MRGLFAVEPKAAVHRQTKSDPFPRGNGSDLFSHMMMRLAMPPSDLYDTIRSDGCRRCQLLIRNCLLRADCR